MTIKEKITNAVNSNPDVSYVALNVADMMEYLKDPFTGNVGHNENFKIIGLSSLKESVFGFSEEYSVDNRLWPTDVYNLNTLKLWKITFADLDKIYP